MRTSNSTSLVSASLAAALFLVVAGGCGESGESGKSSDDVPRSDNGAPLGVSFVEFTKKRGKQAINVKLRNYGDQVAFGYGFMLRYFDAEGNSLKVDAGTPHEDDIDSSWTVGTRSSALEPGKTKTETLEDVLVPEGATRVEIIVTKVVGANDDLTIKPIWSAPYSRTWPEASAKSASR